MNLQILPRMHFVKFSPVNQIDQTAMLVPARVSVRVNVAGEPAAVTSAEFTVQINQSADFQRALRRDADAKRSTD